MVSILAILSLNVNISLYFSFVRLSLFVFVFHVPSYSTPTKLYKLSFIALSHYFLPL